jgi:PhnB protein
MATLCPYLHFNGNCEEAFNFYKSIFGGELEIARYKDAPSEFPSSPAHGNKIMNVTLQGGDVKIMGSDWPEHGKADIGNNIQIVIEVESDAKADKFFNALSAGGKTNMPIGKTFWGSYFGMVADKFGVYWMISHTY